MLLFFLLTLSTNSKHIYLYSSSFFFFWLVAGTIVYFEMSQSGQMLNSGTHEIGTEILCLDCGAVPKERQGSDFLVVGSADQTIRLLSLSPDRLLEQLALQIVPSPPSSVCLLSFNQSLHVNIGLRTGVLLRSRLSPSGECFIVSCFCELLTLPSKYIYMHVKSYISFSILFFSFLLFFMDTLLFLFILFFFFFWFF